VAKDSYIKRGHQNTLQDKITPNVKLLSVILAIVIWLHLTIKGNSVKVHGTITASLIKVRKSEETVFPREVPFWNVDIFLNKHLKIFRNK
jgi:hypothetical protein